MKIKRVSLYGTFGEGYTLSEAKAHAASRAEAIIANVQPPVIVKRMGYIVIVYWIDSVYGYSWIAPNASDGTRWTSCYSSRSKTDTIYAAWRDIAQLERNRDFLEPDDVTGLAEWHEYDRQLSQRQPVSAEA